MTDREWDGGGCPVWPLTVVLVTFRNGKPAVRPRPARNYSWAHTGGRWDIVSYRVIEWPADEYASQAAEERKS